MKAYLNSQMLYFSMLYYTTFQRQGKKQAPTASSHDEQWLLANRKIRILSLNCSQLLPCYKLGIAALSDFVKSEIWLCMKFHCCFSELPPLNTTKAIYLNKTHPITGVVQGLPGLPYYFPTHTWLAASHTPSREHISKEVVSEKKCILFLSSSILPGSPRNRSRAPCQILP